MLGRFSEEALKAFAASHNLDTRNQDFSEGVFDFTRCVRPDGTAYGTRGKCRKGTEEVKKEESAQTIVDRLDKLDYGDQRRVLTGYLKNNDFYEPPFSLNQMGLGDLFDEADSMGFSDLDLDDVKDEKWAKKLL